MSLIDPEQANAIEAIALKRVLDTPDLADDYDLVKKQVERNFPLTTSGDADENDEDYQMEQLDMKQQKYVRCFVLFAFLLLYFFLFTISSSLSSFKKR